MRDWEARQLKQVGKSERPRRGIDVGLPEFQFFQEKLSPAVGQVSAHLESNRLGEPSAAQVALDHLEQVVRFFSRAAHFGAADDPDRV